MTTLLEQLNELPKPPESAQWAHCQNGHATHQSMRNQVQFKDLDFILEIWDWSKYSDDTFSTYKEYCTGQDAVSWSIDQLGVWEPAETALLAQIFKNNPAPKTVIDIGAQVGWYSTIAGLYGHDAYAIEADPHNIELIEKNSYENAAPIRAIHGYVNEDAPTIEPEPILLVKCDIEGNEPYAYQMLRRCFASQTIEYALFEISPAFWQQGKFGVKEDTYPKLVQQIEDDGYIPFIVPQKMHKTYDTFMADPLEFLKPENALDTWDDPIETWWQENVLFVRNI